MVITGANRITIKKTSTIYAEKFITDIAKNRLRMTTNEPECSIGAAEHYT